MWTFEQHCNVQCCVLCCTNLHLCELQGIGLLHLLDCQKDAAAAQALLLLPADFSGTVRASLL